MKITLVYSLKWFLKLEKEYQNTYKDNNINNLKNIILNCLLRNNLLSIENLKQEIIWVSHKKSFQGLFIKETKSFVYFTPKLSNKNNKFKINGRNTFVKQNSLPIINFVYKNKDKIDNLFISINPIDNEEINKNNITDINITDSIKSDFRFLSIVGFQLTNSLNVFKNINEIKSLPNLDLHQFLKLKKQIRFKNKKNKSLFIEFSIENGVNYLDVFGKFDGANVADTIITCIVLDKLTKTYEHIVKNIWNISKNEPTDSHKNILEHLGFIFCGDSDKKSSSYEDLEFSENNLQGFSRNQNLLKHRIYKKFNEFINTDECFACSYNISENLIISHIHRHSDIKTDIIKNKIEVFLAQNQTTSGDNCFLLCPNHDKEFEKGLIYFDIEKFRFLPNQLLLNNRNIEIEDIKLRILNKFAKLNKDDIQQLLTNDFKRFNQLHQKRIKKLYPCFPVDKGKKTFSTIIQC
ncbi:HNH endonuclease [Mycoplasma leonicaptivi]|uniref:HNH endonuclease n=1 Tax=Mycoplasma leonicaptivi TaxID=36742 RepID=UPI00048269EE|nr:HNH endonuclease [Mycoplasma leonicaptivi]